uniref:BESS domain-containing protein n=1 Tax=Ascaris lumbricoides TaxID=6252 RepID=A0A0M3HRY7_ASCLU
MDPPKHLRASAVGQLADGVDHAERSEAVCSSTRKQLSDSTAWVAAVRRRGRHRKSDAAIDAAIFSMLLSDRNLSSMAVHREMLKNPRYSLSERTLRRRMNEFLEFQRARSVCGDNVDDPVLTMGDPSQVQEGLVGSASASIAMGNNRFDENASCSDDTAISSLHKLFAYAESNVFARDFDGDAPSFSTDSVARNELKFVLMAHSYVLFQQAASAQPSGIAFDAAVVKDESQKVGMRSVCPPVDHVVEPSSFQGQNQAELVDEVASADSDRPEELRERLETDFASLSHEAVDEFMKEVELAVQQHRREMAARAAQLMSELPASKKRELLCKLKERSRS